MLSKPVDRTVLVDASLYGMGKSAGNLPIELISMHMNALYGKSYNTSQMLEAIDINIMPFFEKVPGATAFSSILRLPTTVIQTTSNS